ncbi:MAG: hypothetical protein LCH37_08245 [Bacteroidetes bacterium]|nr:hypothetical protein [Bacteroidota bacterium]
MFQNFRERLQGFGMLLGGILILLTGLFLLFWGNEQDAFTRIFLSPDLEIRLSSTQQLALGGLCFASIIVLFGRKPGAH